VPLHPTTVDALTDYATRRDANPQAACRTAFFVFVFDYGRPAGSCSIIRGVQALRATSLTDKGREGMRLA